MKCRGCQVEHPDDAPVWRTDRGKASGRQRLCKRCHSARESERQRERARARTGPVPQAPIEDDEDTAPGPPPEIERMIPPTTPPPQVERYVVTYAQNATPVHEPFLAALRVYCEAQHAHLIVIPGRYKNPTSQWGEHHSHDEWWAPEIAADLAYASTRLELAAVALDEVAPDQIDEWARCKVVHERAAESYRHAKDIVRALEAEARG